MRVDRAHVPRLYRCLGWGCRILDVEEPELYVTLDPVPNAFTYGHTRPFIVLTSGLIDMLGRRGALLRHRPRARPHQGRPRALHRAGHNIAAIVEIIGQATLGIGSLLGQGLVLALHNWYRKAELTADRAGLLCVQDLEPVHRVFMKLAGGAARLYEEMDQNEFMRQIRAYEDADTSTLNKAYKTLITAWRTHPFPILRARELDAWHREGYASLAGPRGLLE